MGFRVVGMNGIVCLLGDDALRSRLKKAIQKKFKDPAVALLTHKSLSFDKGRLAEARLRNNRVKQCLERGQKLRAALDKGEITFLGLDGRTGTPELTSKKLVGHSVKYLGLDRGRTLLTIERHPNGGLGPVLVQYWVYDQDNINLRLLQESQLIQDAILTGAPMVFVNGTWEPIDTRNEKPFFAEIETLFGKPFRKTVEQSFPSQESGFIDYASIPEDINQQIKLLVGTDIRQREEQEAKKRAGEYLVKWESPQDQPPEGIYLDLSGFRLGIERRDYHAKS